MRSIAQGEQTMHTVTVEEATEQIEQCRHDMAAAENPFVRYFSLTPSGTIHQVFLDDDKMTYAITGLGAKASTQESKEAFERARQRTDRMNERIAELRTNPNYDVTVGMSKEANSFEIRAQIESLRRLVILEVHDMIDKASKRAQDMINLIQEDRMLWQAAVDEKADTTKTPGKWRLDLVDRIRTKKQETEVEHAVDTSKYESWANW
jgi:hypothetical protein